MPTQDSKALQQKWIARITHARAHWGAFHKRVRHNRNTVAGFNWNADPTSKDFYSLRANLIQPHAKARERGQVLAQKERVARRQFDGLRQ